MKTCFEIASVALFDLLTMAASQPARQQDNDGVGHAEDEEVARVHRSILLAGLRDQQHQAVAAQAKADEAQNEDEELHGSVAIDVAVDAEKQGRREAGPHNDRDSEFEVGHSDLGLLLGAALCLCVALDDQLAQLQSCVGCIGDLARFPAREPGLRDAGTAVDLALRQVVLLPKAHQETAGFALLGAHRASS